MTKKLFNEELLERSLLMAGHALGVVVFIAAVGGLVYVLTSYVAYTAEARFGDPRELPDTPSWTDMRESLLGVTTSLTSVASNPDSTSADGFEFDDEFADILEQLGRLYGIEEREESAFSTRLPKSVLRQFVLTHPRIPEEAHTLAVAGLQLFARDLADDSRVARIFDPDARTTMITVALEAYTDRFATAWSESIAESQEQAAEMRKMAELKTHQTLVAIAALLAAVFGAFFLLILSRIERHLRPSR